MLAPAPLSVQHTTGNYNNYRHVGLEIDDIDLYIKCPHCSSAHLDGCPNSRCSTSRYLCSTCGKSWTPDSDVSGNPLAVFLPHLHGNRLLFAWTEGDGTLLSVVVEPSWLGLVHEG